MAFLRKGRPDTGVFQLEGYTASQGCKEVKVKTVGDIVLVNALYRPATRDHGYTDLFIDNRANPKQIYYPHEIFKDHLSETFGVPVFQEQVLAILRDLGMPVEELNDFLTAVKGKHATGGYSDKSTETFLEHKNKFLLKGLLLTVLIERTQLLTDCLGIKWPTLRFTTHWNFIQHCLRQLLVVTKKKSTSKRQEKWRSGFCRLM